MTRIGKAKRPTTKTASKGKKPKKDRTEFLKQKAAAEAEAHAIMSAPLKKTGRPSDYTPEKARDLCEHIATGRSLASWSALPGNSSIASVYRWFDTHPEFRDLYMRAKEDGAEALADQIVDIADDDTISPDSRRVRIDARKWVAMKLKPHKYGDKVQVEANINRKLNELSDDELAAIAAGGRSRAAASAEGSKSTH